jgi:hypothetical protein
MKKDQIIVSQATKNPLSLSNLHSLTIINMEKQRKIINHQGREKEEVPELKL